MFNIIVYVFFYKQKTAYEMRISDCSSDVCSSDLQMPVTFDQAMTQVHNAAIVTFGAFDQGSEFSTMLANFVSGGADGFKGLERSAEDLGINIRSAFSGLSDAFEPMLEGALSVFGQVND